MVLKSLEMQGFKSFPDKTTLRFDKGMTAIVGPNGSGKSNISDAVRWVLGEQSTKNLRGAKMEDVIFGGTDKRRPMGYAEVTLRLDNSDRSLPVETDEVAVTRRYYRSGEGEYKINGKTARLRDINELFMDTGLGRDGYSMVSQGKIADMVSNKSSQRREMLEEAAGISHFRYRRADALRRLNQAEDNLVRLRDILGELEGRVGPLKEQSEKAQRFLVLADQRKTLEIGLWLYNIDDLKKRLKEQEHKIDYATAQYNDAETSLQKIEESIEACLEKTRGFTIEIDKVRSSASGLEQQAAELRSKIAVNENSIALKQENIRRVQEDMRNAALERTSVEENIQKTEDALTELQKQKAAKEQERESLNEKGQELFARSREADADSRTVSQALKEIGETLADARVRKSAARSSLEEIRSRGAQNEATQSERNEVLQKLEHDLEAAEQKLQECTENAESLTNAISGYKMRLERRSQKLQQLEQQADALRREMEQKESRAHMLEDLQKNMEGYTGSVKAVVKSARRGVLRGIHGPLSQLIHVPEQYAAAIETALGAAVQFIVVDTEEDAKQAIRYLKNNRGGRATFLPISAIRPRELQENGIDRAEGFVGIASDLVRADSKYDAIIRAQLGRVVVVRDMDSAIALGRRTRNRFKIVTLDGQTINAGGSMTGGSRARNAGILSRAGAIDALKQEVASLQQKYSAAEEQLEESRSSANKAKADYEGAQADLIRANEARIAAEGDRNLVRGQYDSVRTALAELEQEQADAESRMQALSAEIEKTEAEEQKALARQQELETRSAEAEEHLAAFRAEVDEIAQSRSALKLTILGLDKDMEQARASLERLHQATQLSADTEEKRKAETARYEQEIADAEAEIVSLKEQAESLRTAGENARSKIDELTASRNEAEAESNQLRVHERNKSDEREKISGELARLEERKANMLRDYDATVNKLYDEYQMTRREAEAFTAPSENPAQSQKELREVRASIKALGSVNVGAIDEYKEVSARYEFMKGQIEDVETSKQELLGLIRELTDNMAKQFRTQFDRINAAFRTTFTDLFGGGKAELLLEDEGDILESPIQIRVQPPGKNVQNIDLLSGGEKGLSAIALLFAILKITPAPFCIFDEVEAALDDVNVNRFAQYMRTMSDHIQFIAITHRRGTMEEADIMYGVTMEEEGVSKLLELQTAEMAKKLGLD